LTVRGGLVVVLPELAPDSATHYAHYVPLLRHVARLVETTVVVERGGAPPLDGVEVIAQRRRHPVARAAELAAILLRLRRHGYRAAYGSYSAYFGLVAGVLGRLTGLRTAFWHCRSDFFDPQLRQRFGRGRIVRDLVPLVLSLHLARSVITGTEGLARQYAGTFRLPREKVRVVPNDIDVAAWRPPEGGAREHGRTILFVHRLSEHKGSRLLPEIFRRVAERVPDARLVVAGGGPDERHVRTELAEAIRRGRAALMGYVPNSTVRALMHEADVLLMPSLEEGFPRVLIQAMAAGLPVVAADVGGVAEVAGERTRELLVAPGDVEGFAARVVELLENPRLRAELAQEGAERVRRYDVPSVAPRFIEAVCRP
jgi:glycosyltransferase involved in cell wall biosynthesis